MTSCKHNVIVTNDASNITTCELCQCRIDIAAWMREHLPRMVENRIVKYESIRDHNGRLIGMRYSETTRTKLKSEINKETR